MAERSLPELELPPFVLKPGLRSTIGDNGKIKTKTDTQQSETYFRKLTEKIILGASASDTNSGVLSIPKIHWLNTFF